MAHPKLRSCSKQKWTANANYRRIPLALAVGVSTGSLYILSYILRKISLFVQNSKRYQVIK